MQKLYQKLDMDDLAVEAIELGRQVADRARSVYLGDNAKDVAFVSRCLSRLKERQPFNQADEGGFDAVKDILDRCIASECLGVEDQLEETGYDEFGPLVEIRKIVVYSKRGKELVELQSLFQRFMDSRNSVLDHIAAHRSMLVIMNN